MDQPNQIIPTQYVMNEVGSAATTEVVRLELVNTQPTKKRKAGASGSRQSSACWEHFIRLPDDLVDTPTAACKHCHKKYLCDLRTHGTTNMNHHILKCAKKLRTTDPTQTILTYPSVEGSSLGHVSSKFDKQACRKALSIFVVLDEQPFSAVEGEGFKYYSKVMQPQFTLPSRLIPNHKGDTVGRKIEEVLRDWGIRNVSTITVDNATSNDVAVAYLHRKISTMNGTMGDGKCFHMRCVAHILNLVVNEGLKDKHLSITSVRDAVRFVKSSPHRATKFKEFIEFAGIACKKLVCLDVSTRWNATYLMLEVAEKFQAAFDKLEYEESSYRKFFGKGSPPSSDDWDIVRAFISFLKLFYEATNVFSTSQSVSLHSAFHQVPAIYCELKQATRNLNGVFASVGGDMMEKYNRYWGCASNMNKLIYFGIILDPRYKLSYIEWTFKDMYGVGSVFATGLIKSIKERLQKLYDWYKQAYDQNHNRQPLGSGENNVSNDETIVGRPSLMARADAFKQHLKEQDSIDQKNELEGFYSTKDIFATPVSMVASESAFSTGGRVLETYRSSLKPEMAEALICTQNWLKPSFTYFKDLNLMEDFELSEDIINLKKFLQQQEKDLYRLSHNLLVVLEKYGVGNVMVGCPIEHFEAMQEQLVLIWVCFMSFYLMLRNVEIGFELQVRLSIKALEDEGMVEVAYVEVEALVIQEPKLDTNILSPIIQRPTICNCLCGSSITIVILD
ncbi:zinc finger BED domain-containing protein RICESLEEPER 2-like [Lathyrus oleraceus]|uniref:zinc finger BED domain-containing protein RICESLEEPER 2-like n=1 Tax=Pisum sativum TaxID=3888 RepID=UPI0021D04893|nr:zinc finger BED domain-containing protein RICESLEEPER 2-like [Pisum sativum]